MSEYLTDEDREALAGSLRWHFACHADEPGKSYDSLGIENAVLRVEAIVARHVEAERDALLRESYSGMGMVPEELLRDATVRLDEQRRMTDEAERERDEALMLVRQGAAGSLCPDLRVHGERVQRIVAEVARAEAALEKVRALVHSDESDRFRDEACRNVVEAYYASNRYVRLLDDLRAAVGGTP